MSKKAKNSNTFSYSPTTDVPKLSSYAVTWDLTSLFYTDIHDAQIERDITATERVYTAFQKKYRNGMWKKNVTSIQKAVREYLTLREMQGAKPLYYLSYRRELNADDHEAEKLLNKLEQRLTKLGNSVLFFELELAKLPKKMQAALCKDPKTQQFRYFLESVFDDATFQLTEPEEKILNYKANTSRHLWVNATEKILNRQTITWKGKEMPINGALMEFEHLPRTEARRMYDKIVPILKHVGETAESELTALVLDKQTDDELRGYEKPYSSTTRAFV